MNFLKNFLAGKELKFLSDNVNAQVIHSLFLAHSQMTKNTKNVDSRLVRNSCPAHSQAISRQPRLWPQALLTKLNILAWYKHSSLFSRSINDKRKKL
jgi:hypothetical protein